jgi:hypothetical protein
MLSNILNALSSSLPCPALPCPALTPITHSHCLCSARNQSDGVSSCPSNVQGVVGVSKAQRVSMFNGPTSAHKGLQRAQCCFPQAWPAQHVCMMQETAQGPAPQHLGCCQVVQRPRLRPGDACTALGSLWAVIDPQSLREEGN